MDSFRDWNKFSIEVKKLAVELRRNPEEAAARLEKVEKDFNDLVAETKTALEE